MDGSINQDFTVGILIEDSAGPRTGLTDVSVTVTNRASGATVATGTATESPAGSGYYEYTVNSTLLPSAMRLRAVFTSAAAEAYAEQFFTVGVVPSWARTRRELRQEIARRVEDEETIWEGDATGGSTTTVVAPWLTLGGEGGWRGLWAWFSDGANRGQERRVTGFAEATTTLTVAPALPAAVAAGHRVELARRRPSAYNRALADAVSQLAGRTLAEADETLLATDGSVREWTLPSDARYVVRVGIVRTSDSLFLSWLPHSAWELLPGGVLRVVQEGGALADPRNPFRWSYSAPAALPAGYKLRVLLLTELAPPLYDDSFVAIRPEAVLATAHYLAALAKAVKDEGARQTLPFLERQATRWQAKAAGSLPAGARQVER